MTQLRDAMKFMDMDALKKSGAKPHWFGLGFIQLKLNDRQRMHFWHPSLSADTSEEELHDHRYDFTSAVLHGETTHEVYKFERIEQNRDPAEVDNRLYRVSCKPGASEEPVYQCHGSVVAAGSYTMVKGSVYTFPHDQFHRIRATECVTFVTRAEVVKEHAMVIRHRDTPHVCPFERKIAEDELWDYIEELVLDKVRLPGSGYHLRAIPKGVLGEVSKIEEELEEFKDALKQDNPAMAFIELADQIGAIEAWLQRHHPSVTLEHLINMKEATRRAFVNNHRS